MAGLGLNASPGFWGGGAWTAVATTLGADVIYDADLDSVTLNGSGKVEQMLDLSGNGHHAVAPAGAECTFAAEDAGLGGLPTVTGVGSEILESPYDRGAVSDYTIIYRAVLAQADTFAAFFGCFDSAPTLELITRNQFDEGRPSYAVGNTVSSGDLYNTTGSLSGRLGFRLRETSATTIMLDGVAFRGLANTNYTQLRIPSFDLFSHTSDVTRITRFVLFPRYLTDEEYAQIDAAMAA